MNIFIIIFIIIFPLISFASIPVEDCLECHDKYTEFKHGKTSCIQCHNDINSLPHDEKLKKPSSCDTCHGKITAKYTQSIHNTKGLSCKGCHDVHFTSKVKKDCLTCHAGVSHTSIPSKDKHFAAINCNVCHGRPEKVEAWIDINTGRKILPKKDIIDPDGNLFLDFNEWKNFEAILKNKTKGKLEIKKEFIAKADPHYVTKKALQCKSCHGEGGIYQHVKIKINGIKAYGLEADPKIFIPELPSIEDYKYTVHGRKGIKCYDCHKSEGDTSDKTCIACHDKLYNAHKDTVHSEKGQVKCTDCHNPHLTKSYRGLSASDRLSICVRCHKDYMDKHKWLPNTVLHFRYLECSTCHSPESTKSMVFHFATQEKEKTIPLKYQELEMMFGKGVTLSKIIDKDMDGTISCRELTAFFNELRKKHQKEVIINSSIVVTKVHHNYSERNTKSRVCTNCHSENAPFYESMFLSVSEGENAIHIPVKRTVLSAYPISLFIDMCLLGGSKIRTDDINAIIRAGWKEKPQAIDELGFKLIDFIGIFILLLTLFGIVIHVLLRILFKR